jgi:hypothetical protein
VQICFASSDRSPLNVGLHFPRTEQLSSFSRSRRPPPLPPPSAISLGRKTRTLDQSSALESGHELPHDQSLETACGSLVAGMSYAPVLSELSTVSSNLDRSDWNTSGKMQYAEEV